MATVNKNFKIKSGLVVEGTTGTINGQDILTKSQADVNYIIDQVGGSGVSTNTPDTLVLRDGSGNFAANQITANGFFGDLDGQAATVASLSGNDTDDLTEGTTNKYFTDQRALNATASAYDASGAAGAVASDLSGHISDTSTHGVTGDIVGTSDSQDLSNKKFKGTTYFQSAGGAGGTNNHIDVDNSTGKLIIESGYALDVTAQDNVTVKSFGGDIVLAADGASYLGSVTSGNQIATKGYVDGLASGYDAYGAASQALTNANGYTDTAVANLVDSAPALLDTLNELAAAINDDANFASTIGTSIGEKVAKSGDTMTGELVLAADPTQSLAAATKQYVDSAASNAYNEAIVTADTNAQATANTAQQNAENYAAGLASNYDAAGSASSAQTAAETFATNAINALTTDDIPEETLAPINRYFTDARAKTAAADLLTSASLTNITITGDGNGITITAENGVADSTTSDLAEGTNLYFTDARAVNAITNATIYPTIVNINDYRKEEATQQYAASASTVDVHSFGYPYESAKYLVRVVGWDGGVKHSQLTEILVTVDGNDNIAITEYGNIHTSTNALATFSARVDQTGSTRYVLTATTAVSGCEVVAAATLLSWAD